MQAAYSWMGTRIHLILDPAYAELFNVAQYKFQEAQKEYRNITGMTWRGGEPLVLNWTDEERDAWNKMASLINLLIDMNNGTLELKEEEMTADYLVRLE